MPVASHSRLHGSVYFSDSDFRRVRELLHRLTGIALHATHRERVYQRLVRRLRALDFPDFDAYLRMLDDAQGQRERTRFVNALTTNFTGFFREPVHFDFLRDTVLAQATQRRLRFWSAGCSTGEEAYSLALLVSDVLREGSQRSAAILATDLDSRAIAVARRGEYAPESVPGMPAAQRARLFTPVQSGNRGLLKVRPGIRKLVRFRQMNLLHDWPAASAFDAIFCRNVMLYFDSATRRRLLDRFADRLHDGGYLFTGCAEAFCGPSQRFAIVEKSVYRKIR
ncbi:MAG: protein-glutamate O-methyltransferase CheR [Thiogranum sp.]|nr:protein-glutamate O-methyltransferase CheR [Thiogranum sp.]